MLDLKPINHETTIPPISLPFIRPMPMLWLSKIIFWVPGIQPALCCLLLQILNFDKIMKTDNTNWLLVFVLIANLSVITIGVYLVCSPVKVDLSKPINYDRPKEDTSLYGHSEILRLDTAD